MRPARGFTLLELLVVIVLVAAVTALAAMAIHRATPGQQLKRAAREVAAELRYTRARALATGAPQVFVLDTRTRLWSAAGKHHGELPKGVEVVATGARSEQKGADTAVVKFFPEGAATGGRFDFKRERATWRIDIEWLTGQVTLARAPER